VDLLREAVKVRLNQSPARHVGCITFATNRCFRHGKIATGRRHEAKSMFENPFTPGVLVEHVALGIGRIVAVQGTTIHIYFHEKGGQCATKLALDSAKKFLRSASVTTHEWLDHLPPFSFDRERNAFCLEHEKLTHEQAVATFLQAFPEGFTDARYIGDHRTGERSYKEEVAQEWKQALGGVEGRQLLQDGNLDELRQRLMRVAQINLLHPNWDKGPLKDGLADDGAARAFFAALFDAAEEEPGQERFNRLVASLEAMPTPGSPVASWPVATIFPYLARPDRHMFVRPTPTEEAAKRLGFELNYRSEPNWRTYNSVLAFARVLLNDLRKYGARDFLDVQSFIFVTWMPNYRSS
jgi:hypothetical protein